MERLEPIGDAELRLGNLEATRDWGRAQDYIRAMWMMLQHPRPDDYVIATGETRTVKDFLHVAFRLLDINPGEYARTGELDWEPLWTFEALVRSMWANDLRLELTELACRGEADSKTFGRVSEEIEQLTVLLMEKSSTRALHQTAPRNVLERESAPLE